MGETKQQHGSINNCNDSVNTEAKKKVLKLVMTHLTTMEILVPTVVVSQGLYSPFFLLTCLLEKLRGRAEGRFIADIQVRYFLFYLGN